MSENMDFEEKMDRNLLGKAILLRKNQVLEEHVRRLEEKLEVKGDKESIVIVRDVLAPHYKAAESPRWEKGTEEAQNPLLIENVIECVVKYLDYRTKQSLREVHSCWNNAILTPQYLNKTVFNIKRLCQIEELIEAFPIKNPSFISFPGTAVIYNLAEIRDPMLLLEWFGVYGKLITNIKIYQDDPQARIFEKLLTGLLPNLLHLRIPKYISTQTIFKTTAPTLQNLVSLEIGGYYYRTANTSNTDSEIVKSILNSAVNLKLMKLGTLPHYFATQEPLEYLMTCRDAGYLPNLIELDLLQFNLTIEASQFLSEVEFTNLKRLVVPKYNRIETNSLARLFENVKSNCEYLRVDAKYLHFLPQMKELKELKCDWGQYWGDHNFTTNDYLSKLPKLQTLVVKTRRPCIPRAGVPILETIFTPYHQYDSIKSLELINIFVGRKRLFKVLRTMQNLKRLKIKRSKIPRNLTSLLESFFESIKTVEKGLKERRVEINICRCIVMDEFEAYADDTEEGEEEEDDSNEQELEEAGVDNEVW